MILPRTAATCAAILFVLSPAHAAQKRCQISDSAFCASGQGCRGEVFMAPALEGGKPSKDCRQACRRDDDCRVVQRKDCDGQTNVLLRYKASEGKYDGTGVSGFVPDALERICGFSSTVPGLRLSDDFTDDFAIAPDDPFGDDPFAEDPFAEDPFEDDPF